MARTLSVWLMVLGCLFAVLPTFVQSEDNANYYGDDGNGDDAVVYDDDDGAVYGGDDYIKYWTDYAILPKRCIV